MPALVLVLAAAHAAVSEAQVEVGLQRSPPAALQVGPPTSSENMVYLLRTLRRFQTFSGQGRTGLESRHAAEEQRLRDAITQTSDEGVREALTQSLASNQRSLTETARIYSSMSNFSESLMDLLSAATSKGYGCERMACGHHASCTDTTRGPECVCNEGFVGLGGDCRAPPEFLPRRLLSEGSGPATQVADVHVAVFEQNKIAVVFRDLTNANTGHLLVGSVRETGTVDLSPPELFTSPGGKAFAPVVVGTSDRRLAVAWRDEQRQGTCWLRGATMGASGVRGADMALSWGEPVNFCSGQAHKMSLLAFPDNRIVVLFSDRTRGTERAASASFGNSLLAQVGAGGGIATSGLFRFSDHPVCRLEVTKITPTSFILAARAGKAVDDLDPSISTRQEAMAMYGEVVDNNLVFDPNPVNIEPQQAQIWSRGVSLIAPNTFAYAYQDGTDMKMKMAVVEVDAVSHRMKMVAAPVVVRDGFSPYVSMLSVPYTAADPHTLVYYDSGNSSMVNLCSWSTEHKRLGRCEDFPWLTERLTAVSGVHLGGGKSLMVFTPESGVPYYGVFGLSKK